MSRHHLPEHFEEIADRQFKNEVIFMLIEKCFCSMHEFFAASILCCINLFFSMTHTSIIP